jgi:trans-aconitate 2-methyltransferase
VPVASPARVVDLGCGPGNSTALLRERWPAARLVGVDNSPEMLARARQDFPDIEWIAGDVATFAMGGGEPVDVWFANAVLHWVPDHATLLPALVARLRCGGALAVQMPDNAAEASHLLMHELPGPWRARLRAVGGRMPVESAGFYYDLLAPAARHVDIWRTTYEHVMPDAVAIVEWVKGSGLRPYLDALEEGERADYLAAYTEAIAAAYPARADGKRLFPFPRLFIVAVR